MFFGERPNTPFLKTFNSKTTNLMTVCFCCWLVSSVRTSEEVKVNTNLIPRQKCFPSDSNVTFVPMIFGGERGMDNCGEEICGGDIPEEYEVTPAV